MVDSMPAVALSLGKEGENGDEMCFFKREKQRQTSQWFLVVKNIGPWYFWLKEKNQVVIEQKTRSYERNCNGTFFGGIYLVCF